MIQRYNESDTHFKAKERIGKILREKGFNVWVDSLEFKCKTEKGKGERTYWPDIYCQDYSCYPPPIHDWRGVQDTKARGRRIVVEVQGFKGHKSKAAFQNDRLRIADIWNAYGAGIEYRTFSLGSAKSPMDIRRWSDADIVEHLEIENS